MAVFHGPRGGLILQLCGYAPGAVAHDLRRTGCKTTPSSVTRHLRHCAGAISPLVTLQPGIDHRASSSLGIFACTKNCPLFGQPFARHVDSDAPLLWRDAYSDRVV